MAGKQIVALVCPTSMCGQRSLLHSEAEQRGVSYFVILQAYGKDAASNTVIDTSPLQQYLLQRIEGSFPVAT